MINLNKKHIVSLLLLSLFGVALTYIAFISFRESEHEKITLNLKDKAEDRIFTFQDLIDDSIDEVVSLAAFFNASEKVERQEFRKFSESLVSHHPGLHALEWIPRVLDAEREEYEESARKDGFSDYHITEREEQGLMIPAQKREEYFPVYYIEPLADNELALGYDLGSDPDRLETLQLSRDTGKVTATSRITLVQEKEKQFAFLVSLPVYKSDLPVDSVATRRKALIGFVLGVFRVGDLLEDAMSILSPQGLDLYIYDENETNPGKRILGFHASRKRTAPFAFDPDEKKIRQGYYYSLDVSVADRTWRVYCVPAPEFLLEFKTWQVFGVPGVILLFFVFGISYLAFLLGRVEKTKLYAGDLSRAKNVLEAEVLERKRAEVLMRKERDRANRYFDISGVMILALNRDQTVGLINKKGCKILGYEAANIIGRNWFDIFIPETDRENTCKVFDQLMSGDLEPIEYFENSVLCRNGDERLIAWHNSIIYNDAGDIEGTLSSGEDITDRKLAEEEKAHLEARLRHANKLEAIGTLAGGIAHDFNNILTIIIGNTELAILEVADKSRIHEKLKKVISASRRAKDLVQQILSFSRKVDQTFQPISPVHIVKETISMLRSTIPATIEIQEDIDNDCGTIIVDPTQIHLILINLCTNGVHSMQENGILGISLKQTVLGDKDLSHRGDMVPGTYVDISVSDTGIGIDPETVERIFDPFFTTKEVGEGTGMGLSMVHGIVMAHRGMIKVDSEPGMGSVFHIYLPAFEAEEVALAETQASLPTGTERILLVDDEEGIIELGRNILVQQGFKVITKESSIEALALVKRCPDEIDLVITDQSMPEMSGLELIAEIRKIRSDIPVILCTGFSTRVSSEQEAKALGISGFIMKPLDRRSLVSTVRKALDEKPGR